MTNYDVTVATATGKSVVFGPVTAPDATTAECAVIRRGLRTYNHKCGGWYIVTAVPTHAA